MGAWIETQIVAANEARKESHPTWVRGLKLFRESRKGSLPVVAPYVGAWIETAAHQDSRSRLSVAPYVGAWIETSLVPLPILQVQVAPYVGAWIETSSRAIAL